MKLNYSHEFSFIGGFIAYLQQLLAAQSGPDVDLSAGSTGNDLIQGQDVVFNASVSTGDHHQDSWRVADFSLTEAYSQSLYYIRLNFIRGLQGDEQQVFSGIFHAAADAAKAKEVGEVIATAVFLFLRDTQVPEREELQGYINNA